MLYTRTIIHLGVGGSGGYFTRRFAARQTMLNICAFFFSGERIAFTHTIA